MDLLDLLRSQARANRLANHRLHGALAGLTDAEFHAARTGFFGSLAATLNHILGVDGYYLAALRGEPDMARRWDDFVPAVTVGELAARQAAMDQALIAYCDALSADGAAAIVALDRGDHIDRDPAARVLAHLLMHQTHHRGQAHAMLSGTSVAPPQLDEFLLESDAPRRVADLAALGWDETTLFAEAHARSGVPSRPRKE
jgi:uncharacterized damage-inducible protein DinB